MVLKEDPWKRFYRTEGLADEKLAKVLQPNIPDDINAKFENRKIVRNMGYTFVQHATGLINADNRRVVGHLIETEKGNIPLEVG